MLAAIAVSTPQPNTACSLAAWCAEYSVDCRMHVSAKSVREGYHVFTLKRCEARC